MGSNPPGSRRYGATSRLGGVPVDLDELAPAPPPTGQMTLVLDQVEVSRARHEPLPGVVHLPDWLDFDEQRALVTEFREWARAPAGLRHPRVPTGHVMTTMAVCLGWHWSPYAYSRTADDTDGAPVKAMPASVHALARRAVADTFGAESPEAVAHDPDAAIVNLYPPGAHLGLHQDHEEPSDAPVVTISLGDTCTFRLAGVDRRTARSSTSSCAAAICWCSAARTVASSTGSRRSPTARHPTGSASPPGDSASPSARPGSTDRSALGWAAPPAAAGGQEPDHVTGPGVEGDLVGEATASSSRPPGRSQFSPGAAGAPPSMPQGDERRRSVMSDTGRVAEQLDLPLDAVAAGVDTGPSTPRPQAPAAAPAAGTPARAPRSACCGCWSWPCARRSSPDPGLGRPARRPRSRSTPTAVRRRRCRPSAGCSSSPATRRRAGRARPGPGHRGRGRPPAGSPRRCRRPPPRAATRRRSCPAW